MLADTYTLVDKDSVDYEKYVQEYPVLADQQIYVLNENFQGRSRCAQSCDGQTSLGRLPMLLQALAARDRASPFKSGHWFRAFTKIPAGD